MFKFPKYAIAVSDYETDPNNTEGLIPLKVGDLMILLREYETGLGWALIQKVDIRDVHRNGCRVYDHDIPRNEKLIGFVPTAFLAMLRFEPEKFNPTVPLDLQLALSENGEEYQKKIGVRFYIYEGYYRDRHEDTCMMSKAKIKTNVPKMHCLESAKFEDFNISMEEWQKMSVEEWKAKARKTLDLLPVPPRDFFLVKNTKHPAHLHWLTKGAYVAETINNALLAYSDRPCLGYRRKISKDQYENSYRWFTYAQLHERVLRFGNGLRICFNNEKLLTQHRENQKEANRGFVGICSINRPDWFVADWAGMTQAMVTIPLPKAKVECLSDDIVNMESREDMKMMSHEIIQVVNNSEVPLIICSRELTVKFLKLIKRGLLPSVKAIVQMDALIVEDTEISAYLQAVQENTVQDLLKNRRKSHLEGLKKLTSYIKDSSDFLRYYYLLKNRYEDTNINMNTSITDLCDWNAKDEDFVLLNYISENDVELDFKARVLANELSIELKDMNYVEMSTINEYPTFSDELRVAIKANKDVHDMCTIVYTSGSTSTEPKGAIITDKHYNKQLQHELYQNHPLVCVSFSPLSHVTDRSNTTICIINGGRVGIYCGEMDRILEDFQLIQPVTLSTTPRFYNTLLAEYQSRLKRNASSSEPVSEFLIMNQFKNILGGRITSIVTGGAATSPEVIKFLRDCFKIPVFNGYASTECGSIGWIDRGEFEQTYLTDKVKKDNENLPPHMLLVEGVTIKLENVPELSYYITDQPNARGEICVKSEDCIPGYYRDAQKTSELIDSEGFYHTGDIGEISKTTYKVKVIDRRKNIFKLAQGEFVAPENLENLFISKSNFIDQMFLYGNSFRSFMVAVIVPKNVPILQELVASTLKEQNLPVPEEMDLSRGSIAYQIIQKEITVASRESKLESYESPKAFIIDMEKFTPDNGKLTSSYKICRPALNKAYKEALDKLYVQVEKEGDITQLETVENKEQLKTIIHNLFQSGGVIDSLSTVRLSNILLQKFGIVIGADKLLSVKNYDNPAEKMLEIIELAMKNPNLAITEKASRFASDNHLEEEVRSLLSQVPSIDTATMDTSCLREKPKKILITGVTGFIGSGLLCEQLLLYPESIVYCLVRASSEEEGRRRVLDNILQYIQSLGSNIIDAIQNGFEKRTVILCGDFGLPQLGLDNQTINKLATELDSIIHCGANVNFIMNYDQLRTSNVQSVIECLKIATSGNKLKTLHFVSSISVVPHTMAKHHSVVQEDFVPLNVENFQTLNGGYPQSKFISEHILRLAMEEKNIKSIAIYRPGLVVGHSKNGFSSVREWISRLMCGMIHLGVAPQNSVDSIHMLPVDFCAQSIIAVVNSSQLYPNLFAQQSAHNIFNVININRNNPLATRSVHSIVQVMKKMGFKVNEVPYGQFVETLMREINNAQNYPNMTNENTIFGILNLFPAQYDRLYTSTELDTRLGCANLVSALESYNANNSTPISCPLMSDEHLIELELKYFIRTGDVEPPQ